MDPKEMVLRHLMRGACCSEALIRFGFELKDPENIPDGADALIKASAALCNGMHSGSTCGVLTAGCLVLGLFDRASAPALCKMLYEWFDETYALSYGSINCEDILEDDPRNKMTRCREMVQSVAEKCAELLDAEGLLS